MHFLKGFVKEMLVNESSLPGLADNVNEPLILDSVSERTAGGWGYTRRRCPYMCVTLGISVFLPGELPFSH